MKVFQLVTAALFAIGAPLFADENPDGGKLYELRVYHANPGKLDALHARFRNHTVALFQKHGMEQLGYFVPVDNEESNILVYWLEFADEAARDAAWKGFRNDPEWTAAYAASTTDGKLVKKVDSTLMRATDYSPAIGKWVEKGDSRLFEWRTYTAKPGKLSDINARFRNHTCELFAKHGITNLAYWNYVKGQPGAEVTLSYLVAHPDAATRDQNFKAFGRDPAWVAARDASVKNGPIMIKDGVKSVPMKPIDYSPVKD